MDDRIPCGAHNNNEFDYTCDDCMLPEPHLDPPELAEFAESRTKKVWLKRVLLANTKRNKKDQIPFTHLLE